MSGDTVRYRPLRRTNRLADTQSAFSEWESRLLDSMRSLGQASADRWLPVGPFSAGTQPAIEPGWLMRVAPTALVSEVQLPNLGRDGAGRMVAIQHVGAGRSILRLAFGTTLVAGCTSPGHIATAVWDGQAWQGMLGRIEWVSIPSTPETSLNHPGVPMPLQTIASWGTSFLMFPSNAVTAYSGLFRLPLSWVGTNPVIDSRVIPMVAASGNAIFEWHGHWVGNEEVSIGAIIDPSPNYSLANVTVPITAAKAGGAVSLGDYTTSTMPTITGVATNNSVSLFSVIVRLGGTASDTYSTAYLGTPNNLALMSHGIRVQCCSQGAMV